MTKIVFFAATLFASTAVANAEPDCTEPIGPEAALDAGVAAIYAAVAETKYYEADGTPIEAVRYHDLADFLARNPNCCAFTPRLEDGFAPTQEWREKHSFYGFVRATFRAYRIDEEIATREVSVTQAVVVTTCGTTIWYNMDHDNW